MSEKFFKIETYIPEMALENVKNGLYKYGFGKIGNYDCCMSWYKVESSWRPNDKAKPFLGEQGKIEIATEYKLEFRCEGKDLDRAIKTIKDNHPYEEVCINLFEIKM